MSDVAGQFLGDKIFKNKADTFGRILDELLKDEEKEDIEFIKKQVDKSTTEGQIEGMKGKSDDEIRKIVSEKIKKVKEIYADLLSK